MIDMIKFMACVFAGFALIFVAAFFLSKGECNEKARYMKVNHEFTFFGGCMIETKSGEWIQMKNYIVNKKEK